MTIHYITYIISQDTLFIKRHTFFDLNLVTDHRLSDHHVTGNVNIIPDVGMVQDYIVTCCSNIRRTLIIHMHMQINISTFNSAAQ